MICTRYLSLVLVVAILTGCKVRQQSTQVFNVSEKDFSCNTDGIGKVDSSYIHASSEEVKQLVLDQLSTIPQAYLDAVFRRSGFLENGIVVGDDPSLGRAHGQYFKNEKLFKLKQQFIGRASRHEFGHALNDYFDELTAGAFFEKMNEYFQLAVSDYGREEKRTNSYSRGRPREFFADTVSSYYCSRRSPQSY